MVVGLVAAMTIAFRLYLRLVQEQGRQLSFAVTTRSQTEAQLIGEQRKVARQVASGTGARQLLAAYNPGDIPKPEFIERSDLRAIQGN